jgi:hypothetical protein
MSVQKNLCQFVLYLVGNCVNLCQFGEDFLLVHPSVPWTQSSQSTLVFPGFNQAIGPPQCSLDSSKPPIHHSTSLNSSKPPVHSNAPWTLPSHWSIPVLPWTYPSNWSISVLPWTHPSHWSILVLPWTYPSHWSIPLPPRTYPSYRSSWSCSILLYMSVMLSSLLRLHTSHTKDG